MKKSGVATLHRVFICKIVCEFIRKIIWDRVPVGSGLEEGVPELLSFFFTEQFAEIFQAFYIQFQKVFDAVFVGQADIFPHLR